MQCTCQYVDCIWYDSVHLMLQGAHLSHRINDRAHVCMSVAGQGDTAQLVADTHSKCSSVLVVSADAANAISQKQQFSKQVIDDVPIRGVFRNTTSDMVGAPMPA